MKKYIFMLLFLPALLLLTACSTTVSSLESVGLDGLSGKEILTGVANGTIEIDGFGLSVYDDELIVIIDDERISVDMPNDEFYVSIAPYTDLTHDCTFHSATGCSGELKSQTFFVEYIDTDGNVIISENIDTMANGFFDLWLPRNVEGTMTITQGEFVATKTLTTYAGDPTCETTMQLQ